MTGNKKKIIRLTTIDLSLDKLLQGQLRYINEKYDVVAVSADTGLLKGVAEREGIRVIEVPIHREIALSADLKCLWKLYKLFKTEKPDILHCNTPKGSLLGLMAGKMAGIRNRVYTVTGLRYQGATGVFRFILKTMERISCACATRVIPEGNGVLHCLHDDNITHKEMHILHYGNINGIDTSYYDAEKVVPYPRKDDRFTFVFVGRIVNDKGMHELAYAMNQLPDARLVLVGTFEKGDPVAKEDEEFFRTSDRVECVGWQDDVRPYLLGADALVFPSYREGFPNVPMQAGALNKACIVTNINGCNEIIKDGLNGKIIQPRDKKALLETMRWFLEHPEDVKRMGNNARKMIQDRYEQKDVWKALLEFYNGLK